MPRQRTHHSRRTYVFPDDFPQRLVRFKEESGLSWAELNSRLDIHPETMRRWRDKGGVQHAAHDSAAETGRLAGTWLSVHRLRRWACPLSRAAVLTCQPQAKTSSSGLS